MGHDFQMPQGTMLGDNYQIIKMIGKGGMGAVYMAYDVHLDIRVAIKVVSPDLSETMDEAQLESALRRFQSEAKLAVKIDHPNVIRIFGFNRDHVEIEGKAYDIDYLVMELLAGRTLRNTMDVSGFEYEEEIRKWIDTYMIPILNGLQEVHEAGIIHRDIKPENFLLKGDVPKLGDFGLSLDFDLPPITGLVADIFGTITYMAPEQFYNFSMAREPADIYSIGKILYEVVEGQISEKSHTFKQVKLTNPDSDFLRGLNSIIMAATEENPNQRIATAKELRDRLMQLLHCDIKDLDKKNVRPNRLFSKNKMVFALGTAGLVAIGALLMHFMHVPAPTAQFPAGNQQTLIEGVEAVVSLPYPDTLGEISHSEDGSTLHLIPPAELKLSSDNPLGIEKVAIAPFYFSENPITNQQYVAFLNNNINKIKILEKDVYLDSQLILKTSEKIQGYQPIIYDNGMFSVEEAMHSSCSVLMVTGAGAEAYAKYFGMRLPRPEEWYYVMKTGGNPAEKDMGLPMPVLNYPVNKYGLRGINQVGEWGKTRQDIFVVMGRPTSVASGETDILKGSPAGYYADASFRVVRDTLGQE
ncbi:MAG: protein kinase [Desulfosalsimonadaceae bacterium]